MAIASSITAALIAAAAGTGTAVYANRAQNSAAQRAAQIQLEGGNKALEYERERDRIEQEQYDREYERRKFLEDERLKRELEERALLQAERDRQYAFELKRLEEQLGLDRERLALQEQDQNFRHETFQQRQARLDQFRDGPGTYRTLAGLLQVPRTGTLATFLEG